MIIKKFAKFAKFAALLLLSCTADYGIVTNVTETVDPPPTEVVVDSLVQPAPPESIDVLIVLDTSGSMNDNYEQVSRGVEILRGDIEDITHDYKIGFINTSLMDPYFAGPYDVWSTSIDFLLAPYALGMDGTEAGFSAMYNFVHYTDEGETFFRESSDKLIIFVSDEDEQSPLTAEIFYEWLNEEFSEVQHDVVAIVTVENGECGSYFNLGTKYVELSAFYGKVGIDICSDWEEWLTESTYLVGPVKHINLSEIPIEESIVVYVDNVITEEWYYLLETNTVYLDFEPSEGALIEVGYVIYSE
jgi:hypothetical protein